MRWQHTTSQLMGIGFGKCDSYLYQNREGGFETHGEHNRHKWKLYCQSIWLYRCWTVARNITFKGLLVVDGRSISSTNLRSHCLPPVFSGSPRSTRTDSTHGKTTPMSGLKIIIALR